MPDSRIEWDNDELAKLQARVNAMGQDIIRQVSAEMEGQPVEDVLACLRSRFQAAGMQADDAGLRPCAESISEGTLTE